MVSKEMEDTGFVSFNEALCFACYFVFKLIMIICFKLKFRELSTFEMTCNLYGTATFKIRKCD